MVSRRTGVLDQFRVFQQEIDGYNDRRERLIKASRDVTTASKRLIFHLHRFPHQALQDRATSDAYTLAAQKVLAEGAVKRDEAVQMVLQAARREGLDREFQLSDDEGGSDDVEIGRATRYERAFGSGLEEFVEAVSFMHFLEHASLISLSQVQALFMDKGRVVLPIPPHRYLLGLSDLTGELMRFATNAVGSGDAGDVVLLVLNLIRDLQSGLDSFVPLIRDMKKKQTVTTQSMRKIEDVSYAIRVRSAEYGSNPEALQEMLRRSLNAAPDASLDEQD